MTESLYEVYAEQPDTLKTAIKHASESGYDGYTTFSTLGDFFAFVAKQPADAHYLCFGSGAVFLNLWHSGMLNDVLSGLVDNDNTKHNSQIEGLPVLSPATLDVKKGHVVFVASSFEAEIIEQLEKQGFENKKNIFSLMPLFKSLGWLHHCDLFRLSNFRE